jgi:dUTP pyrophosphatase
MIKTEFHIQLPDGCYGTIASCLGLAPQHHTDVGAGVIDDYRGNVGVKLFSYSEKYFLFLVIIVMYKLFVRTCIILN